MAIKTLILGAGGRVGSQLVRELDKNHEGVEVRLATLFHEEAERWRAQGREVVVIDLNKPADYPEAFEGVERLFLLTTYTAEMMFQSKLAVDAAKDAGVKHIVHMGVFVSEREVVPHFVWHKMVETYIKDSGIAWTNLHPNNIIDTSLDQNPPMRETNSFSVAYGDAPQGIVFSRDIGAVAAAVLREGPDKHNGKDYWLSPEVVTAKELSETLSMVAGKEIRPAYMSLDDMREYSANSTTAGMHLYMESAVIYMEEATANRMQDKLIVRDDVMTVLGRPGTTVEEWAKEYFSK